MTDTALSADSVVSYLVEHGLLDARAIVDGDVEVVDMSRRNANYRVTTTLGQDLLVKQGVGTDRSATVEREAVFLQNTASSLGSDPSRSHLPPIRLWDSDHSVLVFSLISQTHSLAEHHLRSGRISSGIAGRAGAALRRLHHSFSGDSASFPGPQPTREPPWILSIHTAGHSRL